MSNKDEKRRKGRRKNTSNKRDDQSQDKRVPMTVARRRSRLRGLRVHNVIEFQGQPMLVRAASAVEIDGISYVVLSLSRALKVPIEDREVKVGRTAAAHYEQWSFTTRPLAPTLVVERFQLAPDTNGKPKRAPKRRKRTQASDRIAA